METDLIIKLTEIKFGKFIIFFQLTKAKTVNTKITDYI